MVPYCDIFPSDWDLSSVVDRQRYWIIDMWCLKPGCGCGEFRIDVPRDDGMSVGTARIKAKGWKVLEVVDETVAKAWDALASDYHGRKRLAARRKAVQKVARKLPALLCR